MERLIGPYVDGDAGHDERDACDQCDREHLAGGGTVRLGIEVLNIGMLTFERAVCQTGGNEQGETDERAYGDAQEHRHLIRIAVAQNRIVRIEQVADADAEDDG